MLANALEPIELSVAGNTTLSIAVNSKALSPIVWSVLVTPAASLSRRLEPPPPPPPLVVNATLASEVQLANALALTVFTVAGRLTSSSPVAWNAPIPMACTLDAGLNISVAIVPSLLLVAGDGC